MNILKQPIFIGIIVLAMIVAIVWNIIGSRQKKTEATQTPVQEQQVSNLTNLNSADFDAATKKELSFANTKAVEAKNDNILSALEINIGSNLQTESVNTRYIYTSKSDLQNNWMITISQNSGNFIRASIPKEDYIGTLNQINTKLWKYNYVTALQLAEKNGGLKWREENSLTGIKLTLKHSGEKNWLLWIVEYDSQSSNLTVKLDANSGKVVE